MNAQIRKQIAEIRVRLEECQRELKDLQNVEQEKFDNMPEGLQQGETGQAIEESAGKLGEAQQYAQDAANTLSEF